METTEINELDIPLEDSEISNTVTAESEIATADAEIGVREPDIESASELAEEAIPDAPPLEESDRDASLAVMLESDYDELVAEFPELSALGDIAKMEGAIRYGELRGLGLSPREAYLATRKRTTKDMSARAHLTPASPHSQRKAGITMPRTELKIARELFEGLSDSEIEALYKKVMRT